MAALVVGEQAAAACRMASAAFPFASRLGEAAAGEGTSMVSAGTAPGAAAGAVAGAAAGSVGCCLARLPLVEASGYVALAQTYWLARELGDQLDGLLLGQLGWWPPLLLSALYGRRTASTLMSRDGWKISGRNSKGTSCLLVFWSQGDEHMPSLPVPLSGV